MNHNKAKRKVRGKLKAYTIIEAMIAMILVVISFGIGMSIYANVLQSDRLVSQAAAHQLLQDQLVQTKTEQRYFDEVLIVQGLTVEKSIQPHDDIPELYLLYLRCFDPRKQLLAEAKELIYLPEMP